MSTPAVVAAIAAGRPVAAVWRNELGGVTFSIDGGSEYVKVSPPAWPRHVVAEVDRLRWAGRYVRVPEVLGAGDNWLHTVGLPASSAVDPPWVARPRAAVRAIGAGLRLLHDRLPAADCPFGAPLGGTSRLRGRVTASMPVDRLVVCHGDACAPNTLIDDDGRCFGHVDLGDLGVADRWADLAVATLSLSWNYGGEWEHVGAPPACGGLLDAYGVDPDRERVEHYRRSPSKLWAQWNAGDVSSH